MESYIKNTQPTEQTELKTKQKKDTIILAKVHGLFNMWNYVLPSNELILDSDKVFFFDEDDWILLSFVFLLFFFFLLFFLPLCVSFSVSPSTKEQTSGCR